MTGINVGITPHIQLFKKQKSKTASSYEDFEKLRRVS